MSNVKRATPEQMQEEVDRNYEAFKKMEFDSDDKGKYALLKDAKLITILSSVEEAIRVGEEKYPDSLYSFQEIDAQPIDLGIWSHYALRPQVTEWYLSLPKRTCGSRSASPLATIFPSGVCTHPLSVPFRVFPWFNSGVWWPVLKRAGRWGFALFCVFRGLKIKLCSSLYS